MRRKMQVRSPPFEQVVTVTTPLAALEQPSGSVRPYGKVYTS
jgi:hypothetical protein